MKCPITGCKNDATRIVVRDDYDQVRASFRLPLSERDKDRKYGILDSLVNAYTHPQCDKGHNEDYDY